MAEVEGRRGDETASSSKKRENAGEARALFIEEEGNRSPPTTATEQSQNSICNSNRLKTRQVADAVSRNTTPIGTPVNYASGMITPAVTSSYYSEAVC
jgi:hypothetical protein